MNLVAPNQSWKNQGRSITGQCMVRTSVQLACHRSLVYGRPGQEQVLDNTNQAGQYGRGRAEPGRRNTQMRTSRAEQGQVRVRPVQAHAQVRDAESFQKPMPVTGNASQKAMARPVWSPVSVLNRRIRVLGCRTTASVTRHPYNIFSW